MSEQSTLFSCNSQLSVQDFYAFVRCKLTRGQHLMAVYIGLSAFLLLFTLPVSFVEGFDLLLFIGLLVSEVIWWGLIFGIILGLTPIGQYKMIETRFCFQLEYSFQDTFVTVSGARPGYSHVQTLDYSLFHKVVETKKSIFFFIEQNGVDGLIIAKEQLGDEQLVWLRGFLAHKLGGRFKGMAK
ncbi:MAG: YcxB family protein [Oscillospiraceae bacterium]|jgi:hypothetical protein|nr:YcxB family protein [Oscillospiraceae bacterium]